MDPSLKKKKKTPCNPISYEYPSICYRMSHNKILNIKTTHGILCINSHPVPNNTLLSYSEKNQRPLIRIQVVILPNQPSICHYNFFAVWVPVVYFGIHGTIKFLPFTILTIKVQTLHPLACPTPYFFPIGTNII